ncbi:hypothetical protein GGR52DRAFT_144545 [Hypoxylon sp. FL1284]|nr:hypothetical protein GGR52DRAFT_144545 [Hypoxylon sp. FL1284]
MDHAKSPRTTSSAQHKRLRSSGDEDRSSPTKRPRSAEEAAAFACPFLVPSVGPLPDREVSDKEAVWEPLEPIGSAQSDEEESVWELRKSYNAKTAEESFRIFRLVANHVHFQVRNFHDGDALGAPLTGSSVALVRYEYQYPPDPTQTARMRTLICGEMPPKKITGTVQYTLPCDAGSDLDESEGEEDRTTGDYMGLPVKESAVRTAYEQTLFAEAIDRAGKGRVVGVSQAPMVAESLPQMRNAPTLALPIPVPDSLFGCPRSLVGALFSQCSTTEHMTALTTEYHLAKALDEMLFPGFVAEFKSSSLWVAENQVINGLVACSYMVGQFHDRLCQRLSGDKLELDTTAFGLASDGSQARMYVSWREIRDETIHYEVRFVDTFDLMKDEQYEKMRMNVINVFHWLARRTKRLRGAFIRMISDSHIPVPLPTVHTPLQHASPAARTPS